MCDGVMSGINPTACTVAPQSSKAQLKMFYGYVINAASTTSVKLFSTPQKTQSLNPFYPQSTPGRIVTGNEYTSTLYNQSRTRCQLIHLRFPIPSTTQGLIPQHNQENMLTCQTKHTRPIRPYIRPKYHRKA